MADKTTPDIEKKYTFTKEEQYQLSKIEIALDTFEETVKALHFKKELHLQQALQRIGEDGEKEGYTKHLGYNIGTGEITITYKRTSPKIELAKLS